jgi:hypothetical protein
MHDLVGRDLDQARLRALAQHEIAPGRGARVLERGGRLVDEALDLLVVLQHAEMAGVDHGGHGAGPLRGHLVARLEGREDLALLAADLVEGGEVGLELRARLPEALAVLRVHTLRLEPLQLRVALAGDHLQVGHERLDLLRRPAHQDVAAGDLRTLQGQLGVDGLERDRLLLVGGGGEPLHRLAADLLVDDHAGNEHDAAAHQNAELGTDSTPGQDTDQAHRTPVTKPPIG